MTGKLSRTIALILFSAFIFYCSSAQDTLTEEQVRSRANFIHQRAITLDTHVDIGGNYATEEVDPGIDNPRLKVDLVKMNKGGMDGVFLAVFVGQGKRDAESYARVYDAAINKFNAIHRLTEEMYPDRCELALTADDIERVSKTGKRAIMIGIENGYAIGTDINNVEKFYNLGTRYITLSHGGHNQICDSCSPSSRLGDDGPEYGGISEFGEQVVSEMNRLGIVADVSHISRDSFWDLIRISKSPIMASHSACKTLTDNPRNLDDDQLKALAKNGGVIQVVALGNYLQPKDLSDAISALREEIQLPGRREMSNMTAEERAALQPKRDEYNHKLEEIHEKYGIVDVTTYVDHIDHAVKIAGIDHVGIGTDFDGGGGIPGFNNHAEALNVTIELVKRGYSEEDIYKIWGGNLLRVIRANEDVAKKISGN